MDFLTQDNSLSPLLPKIVQTRPLKGRARCISFPNPQHAAPFPPCLFASYRLHPRFTFSLRVDCVHSGAKYHHRCTGGNVTTWRRPSIMCTDRSVGHHNFFLRELRGSRCDREAVSGRIYIRCCMECCRSDSPPNQRYHSRNYCNCTSKFLKRTYSNPNCRQIRSALHGGSDKGLDADRWYSAIPSGRNSERSPSAETSTAVCPTGDIVLPSCL